MNFHSDGIFVQQDLCSDLQKLFWIFIYFMKLVWNGRNETGDTDGIIIQTRRLEQYLNHSKYVISAS